ncbi:MAG: iron-containing alcohol dehydrogenase [Candidatus Limiplasma sp.]|nr:iron-containing alcohol dehydrogenase [Candidatus Limiplasma sp.]
MFRPFCPVEVQILNPQDAQRAVRALLDKPAQLLVLASRARLAQLGLTPFLTALQGDGHAVQLISDIPANPAVSDVAALLARLREAAFAPTAILAIGGGSCIDLGKAVAALYHLPHTTHEADVRAALVQRTYLQPHICIDLLAMPTTAGTGSEVTRWATVWDPSEQRKLSLDLPQGYPRAAVIVPEWTLGMPAALTLSTGLDALSHAMESFWAVARNPLSSQLALDAVALLATALPRALEAPDDPAARQSLSLGALLAGLAFSQTRTTACHSISYPLTLLRGVPHGFAVALTLGSVLQRNAAAVPDLKRLTAVFAPAGGFEAWLYGVSQGIQPLTLRAFGFTKEELPAVAALSFTAGRMDNSPVAFSEADVLEILNENY